MNCAEKVLIHIADGTAGSGKGTVGEYLESQGAQQLDTGRIFRTVTELWLRDSEGVDANFDRSDFEYIEVAARKFTTDNDALNSFVDLLSERIDPNPDNIRIGEEELKEVDIAEVLYSDSVNRVISFFAQKQLVRSFCTQVATRLVVEAANNGLKEVYIDGRSGRKEISDVLQKNQRLREMARLALTAFFQVDLTEAAHRTLSRDKGIDYRSLPDDHELVVAQTDSLQLRNQRDSDKGAHACPMDLGTDYLVAWRDNPDLINIDRVLGRLNRWDSQSRYVLFDTTNRSKSDTASEYDRWRLSVIDRLCHPARSTA
ncbi:MAG: (d)CMP kinase [Candidatus Saccharimonadales bacterium]